jgi:hypothetical protein
VIKPYVLRPVAPTVALLTQDGVVIDEHGEVHDLDDLPKGIRVWCSYDTARELISAGVGEAMTWWAEEIRWRHKRFEDGWVRRHSDVNVIRVPFPEDDGATLRGLALWRDWLDEEGASPVSTVGSASWSLLRARLERPLWLSIGDLPPIRQVSGGRQTLGPAGKGRFEAPLYQYDLQAAYASTLAELEYGGRWGHVGAPVRPEVLSHDSERCVFVRARVRIPLEVPYGPLLRRPRKVYTGGMRNFMAILYGQRYPRGVTMQGVWTWEELCAAERAGCRILRVMDGWVHLSGQWQPFLPWWQAVQRGRQMNDRFGSLLAKMTGNALWGQFCIAHQGAQSGREIVSREGKKFKRRPLPRYKGGRPPAVDLAETIVGRVRARLYELLLQAEDDLVCVHTDGGWTRRALSLEDGWRLRGQAARLDLLGPQALRYWPRGLREEPWVVLSGVPFKAAPAAFEARWTEYQREVA